MTTDRDPDTGRSEPQDDEFVDIDEEFRVGTRIDDALARAVRNALLEHKRAGRSVVVSRDGKAVELPPEEIPVDEE